MTLTARRASAALLAAACLVGLAGCSSDSELHSLTAGYDLRHDDPIGYTACRDADLAAAASGDHQAELLAGAASKAAASETAELRATVSPPVTNARSENVDPEEGDYSVVPDELRAACEAVGF